MLFNSSLFITPCVCEKEKKKIKKTVFFTCLPCKVRNPRLPSRRKVLGHRRGVRHQISDFLDPRLPQGREPLPESTRKCSWIGERLRYNARSRDYNKPRVVYFFYHSPTWILCDSSVSPECRQARGQPEGPGSLRAKWEARVPPFLACIRVPLAEFLRRCYCNTKKKRERIFFFFFVH